MLKVTFYLIMILFAQLGFAGDIVYPLCDQYSCPFVSKNANNYVKISCTDAYNCTLIYGNQTVEKKFPERISFSSNTEVIWLSDHLVQLSDSTAMEDSESLFIDFKTMQYSDLLQDVFAVNVDKEVVAMNQVDAPYKDVQVNPIFGNTQARILIKADYPGCPCDDVVMPDTHFDEQGNLVLVYYPGNNEDWKTKVIPIDYSQLGIVNS